MKLLKGILAIALISMIAVSCKEIKKETDAITDDAKTVVGEAKDIVEVEVATDSINAKATDLKDAAGDVIDGAKEIVKEGADKLKKAVN